MRFSWKSKEGYERFKDRVEGKLGHKLVDTLETWVSNKYTKNSKPPVICQKILSNGKICGETCNTASIHNIINYGRNIACECRRFSWKSKEGYERFKDRVEGKLGHKLVDTLETWLSNKYTKNSKPPVICQKILSNGKICGETCNTASIQNIINNGRNIACDCRFETQRRNSNQFPCNGECGKKNCDRVFESKSVLNRHISKKTFQCPLCDSSPFSQKGYFYRHFRKKHKNELDEDGSCEKHGIPALPTPCIYLPKEYKEKVDEKVYNMLSKKGGGYAYLVKKVRTSIQRDIKNKNFTEEQHSYLHEIDNNENHHKIAQEILDILIERNMFTKDAMDEAGGILPNGIVLRYHGGLFSLGLDRKNNDLPHFIKDQPVTSNIYMTASGMNTQINIVLKYGEKTCEFLRNEVNKKHDKNKLKQILNRAETMSKDNSNIIYTTCNSAFQHEKKDYKKYLKNPEKPRKDDIEAMEQFRKDFPTVNDMFQRGLKLFRESIASCPLSIILMDNDPNSPDFFKPSLDAIDPRKRHVKGNLRFVCRFLNNANFDKTKNYDHPDDPDSAWTLESFFRYIGLWKLLQKKTKN